MSIFYNLNKYASRTEENSRPLVFTDTTSKSIIEKQSDYEVGVKRFKIATADIPLHRVYQFSSGLFIHKRAFQRDGTDWDTSGVDDGRQLSARNNPRISFLYCNNSKNTRDNDATILEEERKQQQIANLSYSIATDNLTNNPSSFYNIQSHSDYARLMTRALVEQFGYLNDRETGANKVIHAGETYDSGNYYRTITSNNVYQQLVSLDINASSPDFTDYAINDFSFGMTGFYNADGSSRRSVRFSDLVFKIGWDIGQATESAIEFGGLLPDISSGDNSSTSDWQKFGGSNIDMGGSTKVGFTIHANARTPISVLKCGGADYSGLGNIYGQRRFCLDDYADLDKIMMKKPLAHSYSTFGVWVRNPTGYTLLDAPANTNGDIRVAGKIELTGIKTIAITSDNDNIAYFPRFIYNETSQLIELKATKETIEHFQIYFNEPLMNETGFKSLDGRKYLNDNGGGEVMRLLLTDVGLRDTISDDSDVFDYGVLGGGILSSDTLYSQLDADRKENSGMGIYEFSMPCFLAQNEASVVIRVLGVDESVFHFPEKEKSIWKRNLLNGLEIVSNRLAVDGEITGGGNAKRKVLTDFEIDPSSTNRDYLIYTPAGNSVRFYPLRTDAPLEQIDLQVNYVDIFGNVRLLTIPSSLMSSIKLEFRPKIQTGGFGY